MKFNEKYNPNIFAQFLRDFLPEDYNENIQKDDIVVPSQCKIITSAKILGVSEKLNDLHVLEMEHGRDDPRIAMATEAFKILAENWIHNALVIFKNNESNNYRFSYLTITLDENEKGTVVKKYSNARRYSFFLGEGAKVKTPEQQLIKKGRVKDTEDLLSRFSLEVVNKQFYLEVAKYFDELVSEDAQNLILPFQSDQNIRKNFAVRLIGRTMFCWFLKQKKSKNGQLVPDEILSSQAVKNNYYHDILERLFFEVLNTNIEERNIKNEFYDKVPYLNGGLFSPQTEDYYDLDREIGVSKYLNTLQIKDDWFRGFFELLETYNFTIDENTVFDQELSVDPEMLGRIFENLLAEINPETGSSERKRTGSFYTPRQIVEYMVDQSLVEYLKTKTGIDEEKLSALVSYDENDDLEHPITDEEKKKVVEAIDVLKILDPACGSGAFPIGVLQKIVYILQVADPKGILWRNKKLAKIPEIYRRKIEEEFDTQSLNYIRKLEVIKNSIFGIDIQPIAVEVSRLRCFLTLVVESEIDDSKKNRGIQALPNLDFKFVCANSLIPAPEQDEDQNRLFGDDFQKNLTVAVDRYFSSTGANKMSAGNEIHKLIDSKVDEKLKHVENLVSYNGDKKMEALRAKSNKKEISKHSRILNLWASYKNIFENKPVEFFETKYFFPSVKDGFDIVIGNPPYVQVRKDTIPIESYPYSAGKDKGKQNLYKVFIERSKQLSKRGTGLVTLIVQSSLMTDLSATHTRKMLLTESQLQQIIEFPKKSKEVKAQVFTSVLQGTCIVLFRNDRPSDDHEFSLSIDNDKFTISDLQFEMVQNKELLTIYKNFFYIPLMKIGESVILKKIYGQSISLKKMVAESSQGDFNLSTFKNKIVNHKTGVHFVRGKHISRFFINFDNGEFVSDNFMLDKLKRNTRHTYLISQNITGTTDKYRLHFALSDISTMYLCGHTVNKIRLKDEKLSKFILGLLNARLMDWLFRKTSTNNHVNMYEIEQFPISKITAQNSHIIKQIESLIEQILGYKKQDTNADTQNLESQIDELVMDLYELTDEEKEIIRRS